MQGVHGRHPTTLHGVRLDKKDKTNIQDEKSYGEQNEELKVKKKDSVNEVQTYALLDSCNRGIFILNKLVKENQEHKWRTHKQFSGNSGSQVAKINNVEGGWIDLPKTYTKPELYVDNEHGQK